MPAVRKQCLWASEQLPGHLFAQILIAGYARHDDTGGGGNHQRRYLCHQTVADGQQRVVAGGGGEAHVVLHDADDQSADDVDQHDDDAGHGVAAHELGSTVHRPVEVGFLRDFGAPPPRVILADQPGIQIGVDRHLLARHRVQGKPRRDFGDTAGAFGDDHEIDQHQYDEHHQTHRVVAAHQEVAERLDHLARRVGAGMAFEQHHTGGSHVERQAQQGGQQQHRREHREFQRLGGVQTDQQHDHRQRDIEGEQQIEQERRQRQDHHRQDHDHQNRCSQLQPVRAARHQDRLGHQIVPPRVAGSSFGGTCHSLGNTGLSDWFNW
jgi:hypothetical protein